MIEDGKDENETQIKKARELSRPIVQRSFPIYLSFQELQYRITMLSYNTSIVYWN